MEMYRGKYDWVDAMRNYRRCNILDKKIDKMLSRQRGDGRMPFELRYWGSHTGRDSGSGGINMQNLPHGELYGVDLRSAIIAPRDHKLIIADLEQIEARVLLTLVKDKEQLALIRSGQSPYEAHARSTMGFQVAHLDKKDSVYRLAKARVLALGYSAGWRKFNVMAYLPMYLGRDAARVFASPVTKSDVAAFSEYFHLYEKDKLSREKWKTRTPELEREWTNSWLIVRDYRTTNYRITRFWKFLDDAVREAIGSDYSVQLPSGRILRYRKIKCSSGGDLSAEIIRGDKWVRAKIYGGKICENIVQAIARDIFMEAVLRVARAGYRIIMRVHDELVAEVLASLAEAAAAEIKILMGKSPSWLADCPVSVEQPRITESYLK
jgi:DNA polymerase